MVQSHWRGRSVDEEGGVVSTATGRGTTRVSKKRETMPRPEEMRIDAKREGETPGEKGTCSKENSTGGFGPPRQGSGFTQVHEGEVLAPRHEERAEEPHHAGWGGDEAMPR